MLNKSVSIGEVTGARIHYHVGVFNKKNTTVLVIAGLVGVTALAVGILALLHANGVMNVGSLGSIPPEGAYAFIGVGGGLVLVDMMALVIYTIRHFYAKKAMRDFVNIQSQPENMQWWNTQFDSDIGVVRRKIHNPNRYTTFTNHYSIRGKIFYGILEASGCERSIHLFIHEADHDIYLGNLADKEYQFTIPTQVRIPHNPSSIADSV